MHGKYFLKNELIKTDDVSRDALMQVLIAAEDFFAKYLKTPNKFERFVTADGYDIKYNGYELGSYGIRQSEFLTWIYGTGCAEPRLSRVIMNKNTKRDK